jgi:hypothetical protein
MISVNVEVPAEDVARLNAQLNAYVSFLRGNTQKAVEAVSVQVVKSLRAATKQKPAIKKRPVVANPLYARGGIKRSAEKRERMKEHISDYYTEVRKRPDLDFVSFKDESFRFKVKNAVMRVKKGKRIFMPVYDTTKKAAQNSPLREIKKSGLAANTWTWVLGKLSANPGAPRSAAVARGSVVSVTKLNTSSETSVTLTNALPYIRAATVVPRALSNVSAWLRGRMDLALKQAAARAGLRSSG